MKLEQHVLAATEKAKLTSVITSGPWSLDQRRTPANRIISSSSVGRGPAPRCKNQHYPKLGNYLPQQEGNSLSKAATRASRVGLWGIRAWLLKIDKPSEKTNFRMAKVLAFTMRADRWSQDEVFTAMNELQAAIKAPHGGRRPVLPYVEAYPTNCFLYTSPSPRDATLSRMPSSA